MNPLANPAFLANPYPLYAMLRNAQPIFRFPSVEPGPGGWLLLRHAEAHRALQDPRFSVDRQRSAFFQRYRDQLPPGLLGEEGGLRSMLIMDPPDHTRIRRLVSKAFTPRRVAGLEARIQAILDELLEGPTREGGCDLMEALAAPLPAVVIAELLGVPAEDHRMFRRWSNELVSLLGPGRTPEPAGERMAKFRSALDRLLDYLRAIIAERRREARDDLISGMIAAQEAEDALSDGEMLATSNLLLLAGHETTTNLIGNGMWALLRHPAELERLREAPERIDAAVEELLRFDSPVQATARIVKEPLELGGQRFETGAFVMVGIGAANRDPDVFPEPDRLDLSRRENRHLSFGFGPHFCLGAPLARLEARLVFSALVRRFRRIELDCAESEVRYRPNLVLRGLESLPLRLA